MSVTKTLRNCIKMTDEEISNKIIELLLEVCQNPDKHPEPEEFSIEGSSIDCFRNEDFDGYALSTATKSIKLLGPGIDNDDYGFEVNLKHDNFPNRGYILLLLRTYFEDFFNYSKNLGLL